MAWPNCSKFCKSSGCCWWVWLEPSPLDCEASLNRLLLEQLLLIIMQEDEEIDSLSKKEEVEEKGWWVYANWDSQLLWTAPVLPRESVGPFCNWGADSLCWMWFNSSWLLDLWWSFVMSKGNEDAVGRKLRNWEGKDCELEMRGGRGLQTFDTFFCFLDFVYGIWQCFSGSWVWCCSWLWLSSSPIVIG